jgi:uncharacterized protein YbcV (DUF1398 family)
MNKIDNTKERQKDYKRYNEIMEFLLMPKISFEKYKKELKKAGVKSFFNNETLR